MMPEGLRIHGHELSARQRLRLARAVQAMMASIILARSEADKVAPPQPPPAPTHKYPWGWDPPGPRTRCHNVLRALPVGRKHTWQWGQQLLTAFATYLDELQWPAEAGPGITWAEMAVDFEVATGLDLTTQNLRARTGTPAPTSRPIVRRAEALHSMVRKLECLAPQDTLLLGSRLDGKSQGQIMTLLTGLGGPTRAAGISHRPILAGGAATEAALRTMQQYAPHRYYARHGLSATAATKWEAAEPEYDAGARQAAAARWAAAAPASASALAGARRQRGQTLEERCGPPDAAALDADPMVVPAEAQWRGRLENACAKHSRGKCPRCCASTQDALKVEQCCRMHHPELAGPLLMDMCVAHRMSACGQCTWSIHNSANTCCRVGHHRCNRHGQPACAGCQARPRLQDRRPCQCCKRGHHAGLPEKAPQWRGRPAPVGKRGPARANTPAAVDPSCPDAPPASQGAARGQRPGRGSGRGGCNVPSGVRMTPVRTTAPGGRPSGRPAGPGGPRARGPREGTAPRGPGQGGPARSTQVRKQPGQEARPHSDGGAMEDSGARLPRATPARQRHGRGSPEAPT